MLDGRKRRDRRGRKRLSKGRVSLREEEEGGEQGAGGCGRIVRGEMRGKERTGKGGRQGGQRDWQKGKQGWRDRKWKRVRERRGDR